jgi:hypothetical protein
MTEQAQQRPDRPEVQWEVVKTFGHDSGYTVRVQKLPLKHRPRFSLEVGQIRKDGKFSRYINPAFSVSEGTATVTPIPASVLYELIAQAEAYVQAELQASVTEEFQYRTRRDAWSSGQAQEPGFKDRGGSKGPRRTGKTERERQKRKGRERDQ